METGQNHLSAKVEHLLSPPPILGTILGTKYVDRNSEVNKKCNANKMLALKVQFVLWTE